MKKAWALPLFLLVWVGGVEATTGHYIKLRSRILKDGKLETEQTGTLFFAGVNLRVTVDCAGQKTPVCAMETIFRGNEQILYVIQHTERVMIEITKQDLDQIAQLIQGFMGALPEARKRSSPKGSEWRFRRVRTGVKVGRYTCTEYKVLRGRRERGRVCVVPYAALGFSEQAFRRVMKAVAQMAEPLMQLGRAQMHLRQAPDPITALLWGESPPYRGFPVYAVYTDETSGRRSETQLLEAGRKTLDAAAFRPPRGYQQVPLMEMIQQMLQKRPW